MIDNKTTGFAGRILQGDGDNEVTDNKMTNNPQKQDTLNKIVTRIMYSLTTQDFGFGANSREDRAIFDAHQTLMQ